MAPHSSSRINFLEAPRSKTDSEKKVAYTLFRAEIFTVAAELRVLARTPSEFSFSGPPEIGIKQEELYGVIVCFSSVVFYVFNQVPIHFSCLRERCNAVLLFCSRKIDR